MDRKIIETIKAIYADAFFRLAFNMVGTLLPLILGWVILRLCSKWTGLELFTNHGEFALYSASFFAPSLYLLIAHMQNEHANDNIGVFLCLITIIGLLLSAGLFAGVTIKGVFSEHIVIDTKFLTRVTFWSFVVAIIISFYTQIRENRRLKTNPHQERENNFKDLQEKFKGSHE